LGDSEPLGWQRKKKIEQSEEPEVVERKLQRLTQMQMIKPLSV
jgi:hypothetical protein